MNDSLFSLVLAAVLFSIGITVAESVPAMRDVDPFLLGVFFAGVPFGWRALDRIVPHGFIFISFYGLVVYFAVKFVLSCVIGMFVMIVKVLGVLYKYAGTAVLKAR